MKKLLVIVFASFLIFGIAGVAAANLITNGDFQTGDLTGWTSQDASAVEHPDDSGNWIALLDDNNSSGDAWIKQGLYIENSGVYNISFDWTFAGVDCSWRDDDFDAFFKFLESDHIFATRLNLVSIDSPYGEYFMHNKSFSADYYLDVRDPWLLDNNAWITFNLDEARGWSTDSVVGLDNIVLSAVPEPATLLLLGFGLLGLVGLRRKE